MLKKCSRCHEYKDLDAFHLHKKDMNTGRQSMCKACSSIRRKEYHSANREKYNIKSKEWVANNGDKIRSYQLVKYGITQEEYHAFRNIQEYKCGICGKHETTVPKSSIYGNTSYALHVDHCHSTGQVRGLLCFNCNVLLGNAKDNVEILQNAIQYLNSKGKENTC